MQKQSNVSQKIHEDHCCSICLHVFLKPVFLRMCKHKFCRNCLTETTLIAENHRCPLCRTNFAQPDITNDPDLQDLMKRLYPMALSQKSKLIRQRVMMRLLIGNSTQVLETNEDNKYRWTLYVRPAIGDKFLSQSIDRIQLKLHPTFTENTIPIAITGNRTVSLSRLGWGTFRIGIKIFWKNIFQERQTELYHDLQFVPVNERVVHTYLTLKQLKP